METLDEFNNGAGYNANSSISVLRAALESKIALLKFQKNYWEEFSAELMALGISSEGGNFREITSKLVDYARNEMCPFKAHIKADEDGNLVNDQGKRLTRKEAPRDDGYLRVILYWLVSSPWSEREAKNSQSDKSIWLPEDWSKISDDLALFDKIKKRKNIEHLNRNIRDYDSPQDLFEAIKKYRVINSRGNRIVDQADQRFSLSKEHAVIEWESSETIELSDGVERPKLRLIKIISEEASRVYGKDTRWCTSYQDKDTYFERYKNNLFLLHAASGARWLFHAETGEFKDECDADANISELIADVDGLERAFQEVFSRIVVNQKSDFLLLAKLIKGSSGIPLVRSYLEGFLLYSIEDMVEEGESSNPVGIAEGFSTLLGITYEDKNLTDVISGNIANIVPTLFPNLAKLGEWRALIGFYSNLNEGDNKRKAAQVLCSCIMSGPTNYKRASDFAELVSFTRDNSHLEAAVDSRFIDPHIEAVMNFYKRNGSYVGLATILNAVSTNTKSGRRVHSIAEAALEDIARSDIKINDLPDMDFINKISVDFFLKYKMAFANVCKQESMVAGSKIQTAAHEEINYFLQLLDNPKILGVEKVQRMLEIGMAGFPYDLTVVSKDMNDDVVLLLKRLSKSDERYSANLHNMDAGSVARVSKYLRGNGELEVADWFEKVAGAQGNCGLLKLSFNKAREGIKSLCSNLFKEHFFDGRSRQP